MCMWGPTYSLLGSLKKAMLLSTTMRRWCTIYGSTSACTKGGVQIGDMRDVLKVETRNFRNVEGPGWKAASASIVPVPICAIQYINDGR